MRLSIVTTVYNSARYLHEFHQRASEQAERLGGDYEIVYVNDGTPDDSLAVLEELFEEDPHVRIIDLARNAGHHKAMMVGLGHARGDFVFLIDCDLDEDPELLATYWESLQSDPKLDVVYGVQRKRKGAWPERFWGALFYFLFNLISDTRIPANILTARLMTKRYVHRLVQHKETEPLIGGLWVITGFNQKSLIVDKSSKRESSYTLSRKISLFVNAVTSFTAKPLVFIFYLGSAISIFSLAYIGYVVVVALIIGRGTPGYTSLIASVWLLSGLIIFCIGVVGIYISKIFTEVKSRPYAVIRRVYDHDDGATGL